MIIFGAHGCVGLICSGKITRSRPGIYFDERPPGNHRSHLHMPGSCGQTLGTS